MKVTQENNNVPRKSQDALLGVRGLGVQIQDTTILDSIQFNLYPGTITGLVGPNGCGKTTLLRAICGYLPYTGSILLGEKEVCEWPKRELARKMSFVRQAPVLSFDFTVEELVLLGLLPHKSLLKGITRQDRKSLSRVLEQIRLSGFSKRSVQSLSGGERQRAYLAQAVLQDSSLLLLDEPTAHLDISHQYQFLELLKNLVGKGKSILTVFHDLELAVKFSDYLLVLNQGAQIDYGPPISIMNDELLARVFKMHGRVRFTEGGECAIHYDSSIQS